MTDNQQQYKCSRLLLPPLSLHPRSRTSNQIINHYISFAKTKKNELFEELNKKQQSNTNLELKYVKNQYYEKERTNIKYIIDPAHEQEMLARGSIDEWVPVQKCQNRRLLQKQLRYSVLERNHPPSRILTQVKEMQRKSLITQSNYNYKCPTQRSQSISDSFQNLSTIPKKKHQKQKKSKKQYILRYMPQEESEISTIIQSNINAKSREEIEVQEFSTSPILHQQKNQIIEKIDRHSRISNKKRQVKVELKQDYSNKHYEKNSLKMIDFMEAISSLKKQTKTNERLEKSALALQSFNPFFRKIERVIGVCLLRIGQILHKYPGKALFQMDVPYTYFYIILSGKVHLFGRDKMQKVCQGGETLLEQIVFELKDNKEEPVSLEKGMIAEESWLLRIDINKLGTLERELVKYGFRRGFIQLKNIIKRNQIVKNWIRNKFKLMNNQ